MAVFIKFPENHQFIFTKIFGDSPRIRIIEFFIITRIEGDIDNPPWTYLSQISRLLNLSKSSVKKTIDLLIDEGFLVEKKIETHQQNPKRNIRVKKNNPLFSELIEFYKGIKKILQK
ncbi:MAG: hypothetical protein ACTSWY_13020 [Promethearchaeota archaeon]